MMPDILDMMEATGTEIPTQILRYVRACVDVIDHSQQLKRPPPADDYFDELFALFSIVIQNQCYN